MTPPDTAALLAAIRAAAPLVHAIVAPVSATLVANTLLAVGAAPVLAEDPEEVRATGAAALLVNLGAPTPPRIAAMEAAAAAAADQGRPWVLDPVGVGAWPGRLALASRLLARGPAAIKGNASEVLALAGGAPGGRGVDSTAPPEAALPAALALARRTGAIVAVTGAEDLVTDGRTVLAVANGTPLLARVTAAGCAAGALAAAALAVAPGPGSVAGALALFGLAAERAKAGGPGSLVPGLLDALHGLRAEDAAAGVRIAARPA
jgi:hydroxyethylthiazole kinase